MRLVLHLLNSMNEVWRDEVLLALSNACSQSPGLVKEAEKKLENWETQAGFYSLLMVRQSDDRCACGTSENPMSLFNKRGMM